MSDAIPTLSGPSLLHSEGGAHHHATSSSPEAFRLALRLGATSLGAQGWLTVDGHLGLAPNDSVGRMGRRRISTLSRDQLPETVTTLDELFEISGPDTPVVVSVADDGAASVALAVGADHGAVHRLWLRHDDPEVLSRWRARSAEVRLINTVRIPQLKDGAERRAATLRSLGIDALEARHSEWSGGLVALMHRFRRFARATDANHLPVIGELLRMGLDSIGGDHPDRLADAAQGRTDF